jgi:hypothetical protein
MKNSVSKWVARRLNDFTITVEQKNGVRFKTPGKKVVILTNGLEKDKLRWCGFILRATQTKDLKSYCSYFETLYHLNMT